MTVQFFPLQSIGYRVSIVLLALVMAGCSQMGYYAQAAHGHLSMLAATRPIDSWLNHPGTDPALKARLAHIQEIRDFASRELGLPDNGSFRAYGDIGRPYVVWNVYAAPELSTEAVRWCFPFAGCVNYKGFFDRDAAHRFARGLAADGYDVYVAGVSAYSTLGWFPDPVLNTFAQKSDVEIARIIFHELAHQILYVPGDSTFNESFATAVEIEGVRRWIEKHGKPEDLDRFYASQQRRTQFVDLVQSYRDRLNRLYDSPVTQAEKRVGKATLLEELRASFQEMGERWGISNHLQSWLDPSAGNAHISAVRTYNDHVPALRLLIAQSNFDFPSFHQKARELAALSKHERQARLESVCGQKDGGVHDCTTRVAGVTGGSAY